MDEEETGAFMVLSDTHLGLRAGRRLHFFKNTVSHRPTHVAQFMKWLEELQDKKDGIDLPVVIEELRDNGEYEIKEISSKKLLFPEKLVLNGDIFELWDASDQSIQFASHSILSSISRLKCQKLYLIGNHDFANSELAGKVEEGNVEALSNLYPWGLSDLKIIRDTYPILREGSIKTLKVGEYHYLLLHGHQFHPSFGKSTMKILSSLRDGAEAFRLYSWVFLWLWIIWTVSFHLTPYLHQSHSSPIYWGISFLLAILAIPRLFVSIGRPIFNRFSGSRYNRNKAQKGFMTWWKKFTKKKNLQPKEIHVIYGHTHTIDIWKKELEKMNLTLINHPAWVKDTNKEHKYELREVFVYVDKDGFEFFGWRWDEDKKIPFQIPKSVVRSYASGSPIDDKTAQILSQIDWPDKLIQELSESGSKNPRIVT